MPLPKNAQVQRTNDSSIVSKLSAAKKNYFSDDYLEFVVSNPQSRSSLINRGYYIRFKAIEHAFNQWFQVLRAKNCEESQIISLGAGFDTSFFRLKNDNKIPISCKYVEVDFPDVLRRKLTCISSHEELKNLLSEDLSSRDELEILLLQKDYAMLGVDLSNTQALKRVFDKIKINFAAPTFFLSECAITYMDVIRSDNLIKWIQENFVNSMFALYEQIHPYDGFGQVMLNHFEQYGCPIKSVKKYPDSSSHKQRFRRMKWKSCQVIDMNSFYNFLDVAEKRRIRNLELFDEYETFHQKCSHYVLIIAYQGDITDSTTQFVLPKCKKFKEFDGFTMIKCNELLHRYGHQTVSSNGRNFLVSGGFGKLNGKHQRLRDLVLGNYENGSASSVMYHDSKKAFGARMYHTMTECKNGNIIVFGGRSAPQQLYEGLMCLEMDTVYTVESLAPVTEIVFDCKVIQGNLAPRPKWRHSSTLFIDNDIERIFYFGGCSEMENATNDCHILNTKTYAWLQVPSQNDTPSPRHSHSSILYCDKFIIISCGLNLDEEALNSVFQFDVVLQRWTSLNVIGLQPRYSHTSHVFKDHLVLVGGVSNLTENQPFLAVIGMQTLTCHEFSMPGQQCERPIMLHNHCSVLKGDKIITIGGGGNCFSFGSHFNAFLLKIDLSKLLLK